MKPGRRQNRLRPGSDRPVARARTSPGAAGGFDWPVPVTRPVRRSRLVPLLPYELRWTCPPLTPSRRTPKVSDLLGQTRPMAAIQLGLELYAPGYNIFVSGIMGTGRAMLLQHLLEELNPACRLSPDRVYVNNLIEPNRPRLITLGRGQAPQFQRDMEELIHRIHDALHAALRSRPHKLSRRLVIKAADERERKLMDALGREASRRGCALVQFQTQSGASAADIYPVVDGEAVGVEALKTLAGDGKVPAAERDRLVARREELLERLSEVGERAREIARRTERELRAMDRQVAARVLEVHFKDFKATWPQPEVAAFLASVHQHVERDLERYVSADDAADEGEPQPVAPGQGVDTRPEIHATRPSRLVQTRFQELAVHLVKTSGDDKCPVVIETNPTYANLFGTIEGAKDGAHAGLGTIHPGALLRADGGYVVLRVADLLNEPGVFTLLKRTLKTGLLEIREYDPQTGTTTGALQPEPIPIDVKVLLIGEPGHYEHLAEDDPQFQQTFKVHAQFDATVANSPASLRRYADFLAWLTRREGLVPFAPDANAALAEYGARKAGRRDRLTTAFGQLGDLAREASFACEQERARLVTRRHVEQALRARTQRADLAREQVERDLQGGYVLIRTTGRVIGQVNAMTVIDSGALQFGKPCRVTAATAAGLRGESGLLNIEREVALSGPIHDKGVLILHGFLLEQFGYEGPVCLKATLCLEQLYGGVEGDSASSAELYALLSSLARIPIDQGLAVSGSVNQKGEIQSIGGVNEKIEGFYRLCKARKLSGTQGVIIPRVNVSDLMLDAEVVAACEAGRFKVFAIDHVAEGLELLTGFDAQAVMTRASKTLERFRRHAK
jgi:ATP-dependent Lon protease